MNEEIDLNQIRYELQQAKIELQSLFAKLEKMLITVNAEELKNFDKLPKSAKLDHLYAHDPLHPWACVHEVLPGILCGRSRNLHPPILL